MYSRLFSSLCCHHPCNPHKILMCAGNATRGNPIVYICVTFKSTSFSSSNHIQSLWKESHLCSLVDSTQILFSVWTICWWVARLSAGSKYSNLTHKWRHWVLLKYEKNGCGHQHLFICVVFKVFKTTLFYWISSSDWHR